MHHMNFWWLALAAYLSRSVEIMFINVTESMKQSERKQLAGFIFACCIALAPTSPLLAGFVVQSLLAVLLCQLVSTEEINSWNTAVLWHQLRTLQKNLGWWGCGDYLCFLISCSCFSNCPTALLWTRVYSENIHRKAAWLSGLKYFQDFILA